MEYKYADLAAKVTTSGGNYDVWVGWGILPEVGERVKRIFSPNSAYVISDAGVKQHAESVQKSMTESDIPTHIHYVKSGEANKTLETVTRVLFSNRRYYEIRFRTKYLSRDRNKRYH